MQDRLPNSTTFSCNARPDHTFGSISTKLRCPRHVRSPREAGPGNWMYLRNSKSAMPTALLSKMRHSTCVGQSEFFLYLENPAAAIVEMARVTRSGGHVIVFDFDWGAWFIDSDFAPMTRHIEALLASEPRNPGIGRELPHLMRKAKLKVVTIEPMTLLPTLVIARRVYAAALAKGVKTGVFTQVDVEAWWREQEAMEQDGRFYHAHHGYIVAASKP